MSQDMATNIDRAAEFIFENGVEYEKELLYTFPRFTFLRSSDPNHGIYQQKLMEYRNGAHSTDSDNVRSTTEIIEPPPGSIKTLIERTAIYVSKYGLKEEKMIKDFNANNARYNFMTRSDPFHAFYQHKLAEYRSSQEDDDDASTTDSDDEVDAAAQPTIQPPQFILLPNFQLFNIPPGMTLREFDTFKLTAHFVAWYGSGFWLGLAERAIPQLGFMNSTDSRFKRFTEFVVAYSKVLKPPPTNLKQELRDSAAYLETILDAFLQRLQWDPVQHYNWIRGGERAMIDWHASVTKDFANKDQNRELPQPQKQSPPPLEEPDPKRQKFDESALVPEDQFLAQHPGSSTIRVSVPNADGGQVIEITVQSLSESVASLKEKIAGEIQIPAHTHKLISGKAGVLKDNDKSLAHYNVEAGDTLTLSV